MTNLIADDRLALVAATDAPGLTPDDVMSEAGRKVLAFHFARLLRREAGVRTGADPKDVHEMRVAIRRIRSALPIFEDYYTDDALKTPRKVLRRLGRALGEVRDLDVLRQKTEKYAEKYDERVREGLTPLYAMWTAQQNAARDEVASLLDSDSFEHFLVTFAHFLNTPGLHARVNAPEVTTPLPLLVRHVVPRVIYERLEALRAYESILNTATLDALHAMRIRAKELRYALETFEEVLGVEAKIVISAVKRVQDHLGELQDARVAAGMMHDFLARVDENHPMTVILHYLATRQSEKQKLRNEVAALWANFNQIELRKALAAAVAAL